ncbi:MAG: SpoIIE family protein phosphatase [Treponema sp.]|nr:SpoIIE family protein phosphatase [Treponema sp.]
MKKDNRDFKILIFAAAVSLLLVCSPSGLRARDFYWENPVRITDTDTRFPRTATNGKRTYVFWQEVDASSEAIWLTCQYCGPDGVWRTNRRFAGPFSYSGDVPDMYSAAVSPSGIISVAALSDVNRISVFVSDDGGLSFSRNSLPRQEKPLVAPRIYATMSGKFILFTLLGENESFFMRTASSKNGMDWSSFSDFPPAAKMTNPFVPVLTATEDGTAVVFQAQFISGNRISYQLYETFSQNDGGDWSEPVLITGSNSLASGDSHDSTAYHNQRPFLYTFEGATYLAWERTYYNSENSHIWIARITKNGIVPGSAEELSTQGNANRAVIFSYDKMLSVVWFDTRHGTESVHMVQKTGYLWNETSLSSGRNPDLFVFPIVSDDGTKLSFIWQENQPQKTGVPHIFRLEPDTSVSRPVITPLSFAAGTRSTAEKVKVRVNLPDDSSGIAGFSWSWSQNAFDEPPEQYMNLPAEKTVTVAADAEGRWYFKARAVDYAGNWSAAAELPYYLDLTPPLPPSVVPPEKDKFGFLSSNTFSIRWQPDPSDDDVAGYTWNLQYLAPVDSRVVETKRHPVSVSDEEVDTIVSDLMRQHADDIHRADAPPPRLMGADTYVSYKNRRNGLYAFSVAAIDTVGNIGKPSVVLLVFNKYVPSTYLLSVDRSTDVFGNVTLSIIGGGFTYDGTVSRIYIDRDGKAPYDMALERSDGTFKVVSDNRITGVKLGDSLDEGIYRIGLLHPDRGLFMSVPLLRIEQNGTVKIEKQYDYVPSWTVYDKTWKYHVQMGTVLLWSVFVLASAGMIFAIHGLAQTAKDTVMVRKEVRALITGDSMPLEKKRKTAQLKQKGISLRLKLIAFTSFLVIMIILLVSIPLGINMIRTQEQTLAHGLEERVNVLLEGLTTSAKAYMPTQNVLELSYLPDQKSALDEAGYATITGYPSNGGNTSLLYVWATNDPDIADKIATPSLAYGLSEITDATVSTIAGRCAELNKQAVTEAGETAVNIAQLNTEGAALALRTDEKSVARREEIARITTQLTNKFNTTMNELSAKGSGSFPQFNSSELDRTNTEYLFYRPVLYRQGSSQEYVRGIVLVKVSTVKLIQSVDSARRTIIYTAAFIALIANIIGAVGSFLVASIIVKPIRRLAAHVAVIGATADKTKLSGKDIEIISHDEIGQLGETVNEMTHGLVKAAQDEKLLMDGKVVQQTFLPLLTDKGGGKETIAQLNEDKVQCFGYYEGASGVSGDYFDYKKLDNRWYVLIKCDASGHGVPAALIMTVVATLFRKYFENWTYTKNGTQINILVTQINDFIESLGIKGKFATIIICLFDTETGDVYMCNAGDNIVHIYDNTSHRQKTLTLLETPAAGPLPSFMVDMKGGFRVEKTSLKRGDVLFLYTDGIEEATRKFRDSSFNVVKCSEPGMKEGEMHGNHKVGQETEQMEPERVGAVIEAVFARSMYTLEKYHNPVPGEELKFDFTTCSGSIEDVIIALASVEKVFRMYKDPDVTAADTVRADKKIDAFLHEHFNRYDYYCGTKKDDASSSNYLEYMFLKEDEQLDDLTLLAVRRP